MAKYTGSNSYKLDYLSPNEKMLYKLGLMSDEEADQRLAFVLESSRPATETDALVGPATEEEQRYVEGFESAGGADAGTARAAGAAMSSDVRNRTRGIAQLFQDGGFISKPEASALDAAVPGLGLVKEGVAQLEANTGILSKARDLWQQATGAQDDEVQRQRELDSAFAQGRAASTGMAYNRAGAVGQFAIEAAPMLSQAGTSLAALVATRNPALARVVAGMSMADIGSSVLGNSYLQGIEAGMAPEEAFNRSMDQLGVELSTELLVPGGGKTASALKALTKQSAVGGLQEGAVQLGSNILDTYKYGDNEEIRPDSLGEGILKSIAMGTAVTGLIASPGAVYDARGVANARGRLFDQLDAANKSALQKGLEDGNRLFESQKRALQGKDGNEPKQGELFPDAPDFVRRPEFEKPDKPNALLTPREDAPVLGPEQPLDIVRNRVDILDKLEKDKRKEAQDLRAANQQQELEAEMFPDAGATKPTQFQQGQAQRAEQEADRLRAARGSLEQRYQKQTDMFANEPVQENPREKAMAEAKARNEKLAATQAAKQKEQERKAANEKAKLADKARKVAEQQIVKEYPNATPTEFDALVGLRTSKLLKSGQVTAKAKAAPAAPAPAPKQQAKPAPEAKPAEDIRNTIKKMEEEQVWSVGTGKSRKTMTREAVRKKFIYDESKDGNLLRDAMTSGKLKVFANPKEAGLPSTLKGAHFRDNGEIYLFTDNISEDSFNGTVLHEVSHNLDRRRGDDKGVLNFAGEKNNTRYFNDISKLAKDGNAVAKAAMARYQSAKNQSAAMTGTDELVKYFIEEAETARARAKPLGKAAAVTKDMLAAIRTGFAKTTGVPLNVSLNDLNYVVKTEGRKATKEPYVDKYKGRKINAPEGMANRTKAPEFSLIGPSAANWDKIKSSEFRGKVDDKPRKELNTSKAKLKPSALTASAMGEDIRAKDVLEYNDLYEAYPELADLKVVFDDTSANSFYREADDSIILGKEARDSETARNILLHELQHAIQVIEGFDRGDNAIRYLTADEKVEMDNAKAGMEAAARNMSEEFKNRLADALGYSRSNSAGSIMGTAARTFDSLDADAQALLNGSVLFRAYKKQYERFAPLFFKARDGYMAAGGETEARLVEARSKLSEMDREDMPFYDTLYSSKYASNNGKVTPKNIQPSRDTRPPKRLKYKDNDVEFSVADNPDVTHGRDNQAMAADPEVTSNTKAAGKAIRELFISRIPDGFREIADRGLGEKNLYALRALNHLNRINNAIRTYSDPDQPLSSLREYENVKSREERLAMAEQLKREMPEVFAAFNDARRDIAQMSSEIAWYLEGQGRKLSEKDKAVINSIKDNIGNYLTTTYKAFGPKKVRREYIKWLKTPEGEQKKAAVREWARERIFSLDNLPKMSTEWMRGAYEGLVTPDIAVAKNTDDMTREELMEELTRLKPLIRHDITEKALDRFVDDLVRMGRASRQVSRAASMYLGAATNQTIVTPKKDVPKPIRELWGEQDNPVMNVFATLVRQGEYVAKARAQLAMLNEFRGKYIFDTPAEMENVEGVQPTKITSSGLGLLQGKYTTPAIKDFLESKAESDRAVSEVLESMKLNEQTLTKGGAELLVMGGQALGRVGSLYKKYSVVYKPWNWLLNYGGSGLQMIMNGNFSPSTIKKGHSVALQSVGTPFKDYTSEELQEVVRNGILDSALAGEIQEVERQNIIQGILSGEKNLPSASLRERLGTSIVDAYAAADIWAKIANYYKEKKFIQDFHEALGTPLTETELERKTAERIRKTNFSYNRAYRPARFLERNGITNFFTYNMETIRTTIGNAVMGVQDIALASKVAEKSPEAANMLRKRGTERLAGVTAASLLHYHIYSGLGAVLASAFGAPEEDENEQIIKQGLTGYLDNAILTLVNKDGTTREYFDAGRLDPYGPVNEMIRQIEEGDLEGAVTAAKGLVIVNALLDQAINAAMGKAPRTTKLEQAAEEGYGYVKSELVKSGVDADTVNTAVRLMESVVPSIVLTSALTAVDENADEKTSARRFMELMGGKFVKYDPEKEVENNARFGMSQSVRTLRNDWSTWVNAIESPSPEDVTSKFGEIANEEFSAWSDMVPVVRAAKLAGVPNRVIQDKLKEAGLNTEQTTSLIRGKFFPTVLSPTKLESDKQAELKDVERGDRKKRQEINEKYRVVAPTVRRLNRNYNPYEEL